MLESPWPYHVSSSLLTHHHDSSQSRHSPLKVLATKAGDLSLIPIVYTIEGENCPTVVLGSLCGGIPMFTHRETKKQTNKERKK